LNDRGLMRVKISTAIARELSGFMWAIACEVMAQQPSLAGVAAVNASTAVNHRH
ncbi:MAG: hypothetical protein IIB77_04310, partial [Proteobacteria bacterium]|nr:hypothetical protein [Pseudomonadota bacterium]